MHDVRLLLWLRARHARSALNRTLHLVGAGVDDGGWGERAYQLYAVGIMLVWAALMAAALVDAIQGVFVGLAAAVCSLAVQGALLAVALVLLRVGIAGARTTPLKLSHPDIAYLAASAVSARALAGVSAGVQAFAGAAAGAALGFLLGVGLESASVLAGAPAAVALAGAALAAAAVALGWVVGFVRLASDGWSGWRTAAAAFVLVAFAVSWCGVALAAGADALLAPATFAVLSVGGFFVLAVAAIALALLAPRVDMTRVIDENSLHADLCRFGMLSPLDRNDIDEYQRRRKLADRPVRFSLPRGEGRLALVQRAALSHARQYDGLASLVMQGAFVVPLGVLALLGAGGPVLFVFWLPVAVLMPQGVREATRAQSPRARPSAVRRARTAGIRHAARVRRHDLARVRRRGCDDSHRHVASSRACACGAGRRRIAALLRPRRRPPVPGRPAFVLRVRCACAGGRGIRAFAVRVGGRRGDGYGTLRHRDGPHRALRSGMRAIAVGRASPSIEQTAR